MKPGDIIEWTYKISGHLVHKDEILWSTVERRFVSIGGEMVHLLVSIDDDTYSWINEKGLFHARVDDRCYVTVPGVNRPVYLFTSDVTPIEVETLPAAQEPEEVSSTGTEG